MRSLCMRTYASTTLHGNRVRVRGALKKILIMKVYTADEIFRPAKSSFDRFVYYARRSPPLRI